MESESMDAVVSAVVMEHVTRPVRMLHEIHRVLKPADGRGCTSTSIAARRRHTGTGRSSSRGPICCSTTPSRRRSSEVPKAASSPGSTA